MLNPQTRRDLLRLSLLAAPSASSLFAASDFWNKKPAAEWSDEEIVQLKNKSPWAKKVNVEIPGGGRGGGGGGRGGGGRGAGGGGGESMDAGGSGEDSGGGGRGGGGGGGGRGGGGGGGGSFGGGAPSGQSTEVVVRWESAKPIIEVSKIKLPPTFSGHYALSVTGLPSQFLMMALAGGGRGRGDRQRGGARGAAGAEGAPQPPQDPAAFQKAAVDRLLHSATLSAKSKDPETADLVVQTADQRSLVFGFISQALPLAAGDKDIEFVMKLGGITVKAKFDAKEMSYKGELAV